MSDVLPLPERPQIATFSPALIDNVSPLRTAHPVSLDKFHVSSVISELICYISAYL